MEGIGVQMNLVMTKWQAKEQGEVKFHSCKKFKGQKEVISEGEVQDSNHKQKVTCQ